MLKRLLFSAVLLFGCAGCHYARVTDLQTGQVYYAHSMYASRSPSGSLTFIDLISDKSVTLTSYSLEDVSKDEVERCVRPLRAGR